MNDEDQQLAVAIRAGDEQAFEQLFFKYYEGLCRFCCRYVQSMFIAEEMVQDVLANIWEGRQALPTTGHFRTYLYQAVKNEALDHLKHEKVVQKYEQEVEIRLYNEVYEKETEPVTEEGFIEAVQQAIEELPEQSQKIYKLSRTDGFTYPEIADILGVSIKTVEYHISKALSILRDRLVKYLPAVVLLYFLHQVVA